MPEQTATVAIAVDPPEMPREMSGKSRRGFVLAGCVYLGHSVLFTGKGYFSEEIAQSSIVISVAVTAFLIWAISAVGIYRCLHQSVDWLQKCQHPLSHRLTKNGSKASAIATGETLFIMLAACLGAFLYMLVATFLAQMPFRSSLVVLATVRGSYCFTTLVASVVLTRMMLRRLRPYENAALEAARATIPGG